MSVFFFNDTATTEIYTLSLHDALPISTQRAAAVSREAPPPMHRQARRTREARCRPCAARRLPRPNRLHRASADRKSTRLNSSHANISYAVFCLKKKKLEIQVT